jgi:hypothetical protein
MIAPCFKPHAEVLFLPPGAKIPERVVLLLRLFAKPTGIRSMRTFAGAAPMRMMHAT